MRFIKTHLKTFLLITISVFVLFLFICYTFSPFQTNKSTNKHFEEELYLWFIEDVSSNPLNLHYTLANPESFGIQPSNFQLNSSSVDTSVLYENRLNFLNSVSYDDLSFENRLTKDILTLSYETQLNGKDFLLLEEILSPSLGIQAQLPILLAEYTFRTEEDIQNYLRMLASVYPYFQGILTFEKEKASYGTFMSDTTVERILNQCSAFIANPQDNYLDSVFKNSLKEIDGLSAKKKDSYATLHTKLIQTQIIPAYKMLIEGLTELKGSGQNNNGLYYFPNGIEFYEYLLKSNCGLYESVTDIQNRLLKQLQQDILISEKIIQRNPDALNNLSLLEESSNQSPQQILEILQEKLIEDFPSISNIEYEVKYVHKDLEEYLSPAFYLTPPIDTLSPNTIYINPKEKMEGIQLFTTLAHEGFPGHLYQTIFFSSTNPTPLRHLLNFGGYVEGWATYIESYAYDYYDNNSDIAVLNKINQSMNLCLLSYLDTKIHYDGWTLAETASYLNYFGITDTSVIQEIFQIIIESPSNYLKYYMGSLHFEDLRDDIKKQLGDKFSLQDFHKKVLEIGPCQFPILEKAIKDYFFTD